MAQMGKSIIARWYRPRKSIFRAHVRDRYCSACAAYQRAKQARRRTLREWEGFERAARRRVREWSRRSRRAPRWYWDRWCQPTECHQPGQPDRRDDQKHTKLIHTSTTQLIPHDNQCHNKVFSKLETSFNPVRVMSLCKHKTLAWLNNANIFSVNFLNDLFANFHCPLLLLLRFVWFVRIGKWWAGSITLSSRYTFDCQLHILHINEECFLCTTLFALRIFLNRSKVCFDAITGNKSMCIPNSIDCNVCNCCIVVCP